MLDASTIDSEYSIFISFHEDSSFAICIMILVDITTVIFHLIYQGIHTTICKNKRQTVSIGCVVMNRMELKGNPSGIALYWHTNFAINY